MKTAKGTLSKSIIIKNNASSIAIKGIKRIHFQGSDVMAEKRKYRIASITREIIPEVSNNIRKRISIIIPSNNPSTNLTTQ